MIKVIVSLFYLAKATKIWFCWNENIELNFYVPSKVYLHARHNSPVRIVHTSLILVTNSFSGQKWKHVRNWSSHFLILSIWFCNVSVLECLFQTIHSRFNPTKMKVINAKTETMPMLIFRLEISDGTFPVLGYKEEGHTLCCNCTHW